REHRDRDRTQPRRDQDGRLDRGPRAGGRRSGRRGRRDRDPRGDRREPRLVHRTVPRGGAGEPASGGFRRSASALIGRLGALTAVGTIRPDVSRRRLFLSMIVLVVAAACTNLPTAVVNYGAGIRFVPTVADALDDVGLGASVGVDPQGLPYVTYFGFIPSLA